MGFPFGISFPETCEKMKVMTLIPRQNPLFQEICFFAYNKIPLSTNISLSYETKTSGFLRENVATRFWRVFVQFTKEILTFLFLFLL